MCDGDDEEEHFVDLPVPPEFKSPIKETDILRDGADNLDGNIQKPKPHGSKMHISSSSWVHVHNLSGRVVLSYLPFLYGFRQIIHLV